MAEATASQNIWRSFSEAHEYLARKWDEDPVTTHPWEIGDPVGTGESQSVYVKMGQVGLMGIAKPALHRGGTPRAAHEKIVSDLAFGLGLPVPAVGLWDRGSAVGNRLFSVSAHAFPQAEPWEPTSRKMPLSDVALLHVRRVTSALSVLDRLVGETDRGGKHLLVDLDANPLRFASIDYAFSLSHVWPNVPSINLDPGRAYLPQGVDDCTVGEVAEAVRGITDEHIEKIVSRIPTQFLASDRADVIVRALKIRRENINTIVGV